MPRVKLFDEKVVLEKTMNLFWKKGYYATSIKDLVNYLGINRDMEVVFFILKKTT